MSTSETVQIITITPEELRRAVREEITGALPTLLSASTLATQPQKEWLTEKEARSFLGWSKSTMQRRRDDGTLKYSKIEGSLMYRYTDLVQMLEDHLVS